MSSLSTTSRLQVSHDSNSLTSTKSIYNGDFEPPLTLYQTLLQGSEPDGSPAGASPSLGTSLSPSVLKAGTERQPATDESHMGACREESPEEPASIYHLPADIFHDNSEDDALEGSIRRVFFHSPPTPELGYLLRYPENFGLSYYGHCGYRVCTRCGRIY